MDREAVPNPVAGSFAVVVSQGFAAVNVEVIDDQMNRGGIWVSLDQVAGDGRELGGGTIRGSEGKVLAGLRLHGAEDIGSAATLVFTVLSRLPSRRSGWRRSDIGMQGDRLFVQADDWFLGIIRFFIGFQNVLHPGDVFFREFGHGPHFFPATA